MKYNISENRLKKLIIRVIKNMNISKKICFKCMDIIDIIKEYN